MSRLLLGLSLIGVSVLVNSCIPVMPTLQPTVSPTMIELPSIKVTPHTLLTILTAVTAVWQVAPSVSVVYDTARWKFDEAHNYLIWQGSPECILAQNIGRGVPEDWRIAETTVRLGERQVLSRTFTDAAGQVQFLVYHLKGLEYLESESVLLLVPSAEWEACAAEAESLLAQLRGTP
ncbi:hypothetical protein QYE77_10715 [Thermanaerothrix sp. 4228-RoL]|uniref:Uncharacterized protein n=2 Tax=Thermanaerothrix TaxID=1077886 RepID=A0ABU3NPH1_9CHLR|nr:hypothetical protein [Thermanaerothrix sp. 4228-RoL]MDT8898738.1 hypothetical protein [Thermanaerothrix sp. 4228-RoL]